MLGTAEGLLAQKQHAMPEQLLADLGEQSVVMNGVSQVHADQFGANAAGQLFDLHDSLLR